MAELSEKVAPLSETEILAAFREALVAVHPILRRLDIVSDAGDAYDDYDQLAEALWETLVLRTLMWKHGLDSPPRLPRYGFFQVPAGADGYIEALPASGVAFRFVEFLCDPSTRSSLFTVVRGENASGAVVEAKWDASLKLQWQHAADA